VPSFNATDHQKAGFVLGAAGNLQQIGITPEGLGGHEVDAVFLQIRSTLPFVELE
jgi:hypothetical protein